MQSLAGLLDDIAIMLRACPAVVEELNGNAEAIQPYLDTQTTEANSVLRNVYAQPNGTVLIIWQTSGIETGQMEGWGHRIDIYARALRRRSPLSLLNAIIDGVPQGEEIRWRYLCVNDETLPVQIEDIARLTDEEQVDYYVIRALFRDKGDIQYGVSG